MKMWPITIFLFLRWGCHYQLRHGYRIMNQNNHFWNLFWKMNQFLSPFPHFRYQVKLVQILKTLSINVSHFRFRLSIGCWVGWCCAVVVVAAAVVIWFDWLLSPESELTVVVVSIVWRVEIIHESDFIATAHLFWETEKVRSFLC
jgi:hypothetical protein